MLNLLNEIRRLLYCPIGINHIKMVGGIMERSTIPGEMAK